MTDQTLDLDAIEARARAATQGEWIPGHHANPDHSCSCRGILSEFYFGSICTVNESLTRDIEDGDNPPPEEAAANARHIAGMDPTTTLALTAEVRKLREAEQKHLQYVTSLAKYLHGKCYAEVAPDWEPLDDVYGVLTQIDNMIAGLKAPQS